ncbi:MAG: hypothetical protein ACXIUZ_02060 [Lysobacteraceae bacterium]
MSDRATEDLLDTLHSLTATALMDEIKKFRQGKYLDKDGNVLPVPAALLAQAAKFLKDNGVDRPRREGNEIDKLANELPDFADLENGYSH